MFDKHIKRGGDATGTILVDRKMSLRTAAAEHDALPAGELRPKDGP